MMAPHAALALGKALPALMVDGSGAMRRERVRADAGGWPPPYMCYAIRRPLPVTLSPGATYGVDAAALTFDKVDLPLRGQVCGLMVYSSLEWIKWRMVVTWVERSRLMTSADIAHAIDASVRKATFGPLVRLVFAGPIVDPLMATGGGMYEATYLGRIRR